jgi:hypothetical protein
MFETSSTHDFGVGIFETESSYYFLLLSLVLYFRN